MIALVATALLIAYLIVPDAIFRSLFRQFVPFRSFVRTKTEEVYRAFVTAAIPLTMAYLSVWTIPPLQRHPFYFPDSFELRRQDYKVLAAAFYSEEKFRNYDKEFWSALTRSSRRQGRLIAWYYPLVILEGLSFGWLATNYGKLKSNKIYSLLADRLLLPNISEWHVLLTAFVFPGKKAIVTADILSDNDTLYQGRVSQYFLDPNGKLSGLILTEPRRYDRRSYLQDKDKGLAKKKEEYWRPIPSAKLYFFAEKILNLNLNYEPHMPSVDLVSRLLERQFGQPISVTISPVKREQPRP